MRKKNVEEFKKSIVRQNNKYEVVIFFLVSGLVGIFVTSFIGMFSQQFFDNMAVWGLFTGFSGALITCSLYFWYYLGDR